MSGKKSIMREPDPILEKQMTELSQEIKIKFDPTVIETSEANDIAAPEKLSPSEDLVESQRADSNELRRTLADSEPAQNNMEEIKHGILSLRDQLTSAQVSETELDCPSGEEKDLGRDILESRETDNSNYQSVYSTATGLNAINATYSTQKEEILRLQDDLLAKDADLQNYQKALTELQSEVNTASNTISVLTLDRDRTQKDVEKLEEENKVLKRQIEELMAQMKELKAAVKSMLRSKH